MRLRVALSENSDSALEGDASTPSPTPWDLVGISRDESVTWDGRPEIAGSFSCGEPKGSSETEERVLLIRRCVEQQWGHFRE